MRTASLLAVVLLLSGCQTLRSFMPREPLPLEVDPSCRTECPETVQQIDWQVGPDGMGDANVLLAVYKANRAIAATNDRIRDECEQHRVACELPLKRAEEAGAIKITERKD